MCGIAGFFNLNQSLLDGDAGTVLDKMCRSIAHRGPDDQGMAILGPAALGMTRLSIIDLVTGQQPIANEDETIHIVFNGEIYNFQELSQQLSAKGHRFRSRSDTEAIVHLYEEYGIDCLQRLEGMFAFAIWDAGKNRLFLARDRIGEKPLHWAVFDNKFIFGSEIKAILAHPVARRNLSMQALQKYLALEYIPAPDSIFESIYKLMPGHYLLIENGQIKTAPYWHRETISGVDNDRFSESESQKKLIELLDRSVELRLISDVPLGIFLSGGIDSSIIAALAVKHSAKKVKTFSIGFADRSFDESAHAQMVARHLGTEHEAMVFDPALAYETMQELWQILDEPLADASILPTFFLSKMTRRSVTVALSGEGGDELFGGYPTYQAHKLAALWNLLPLPLRQHALQPAIAALPVSMNNLSFDYKLKRFAAAANESPARRHLHWMGAIPLADQQKLIRPERLLNGKSSNIPNDFDKGSAHPLISEEQFFQNPLAQTVLKQENGNAITGDITSTIMQLDLSTYLPDDLLVKSDRASMAASLEVRLPFLAYPLVEYALSLPSSMKLRGLTTKYLLKKAAAPYLPEQTIKRPKKGFGIPVAKWINKDFRDLADELLGQPFLDKQGIFQSGYVQTLLQRHRRHQADHRKELWTLLMFQCWWRKYM